MDRLDELVQEAVRLTRIADPDAEHERRIAISRALGRLYSVEANPEPEDDQVPKHFHELVSELMGVDAEDLEWEIYETAHRGFVPQRAEV